MFNFEKLEVWQKAIDLADLVYVNTRSFPSDERFGLTNQMRRAAVFEVVSQAFVARRQTFLSDEQFQILYLAAEEQSRMQSGLPKALLL